MQQGFCLYDVDSGVTVPLHYKKTPLLMQAGEPLNVTDVAGDFLAVSKLIDTGLAGFKVVRLMDHPLSPAKHSAKHKDQPVVR
jgi:hypothetical protein